MQDTGLVCAYFLFDNRSGQASFQSYDGILRSITHQFCAKLNAFPDVVVSTFKGCGSGTSPPSRYSLRTMLTSILQHLPNSYIIIDALDECHDAEEVATWLQDLTGVSWSGLHVLVTSHDQPDVADCFLHISKVHVLRVEERTNNDIEQYINSEVEKGLLRSCSAEMKADIRESLRTKAGGM